MRKLRLALNKGEPLRYLSHLDYASTVEQMIRRAQIKMAYSEGFNPHMKISFSSALALGITATPEYIDMDVLDEDPLETIIERLNEEAPRGLEVLGGREIEGKIKKMMALCNYAGYVIKMPVTETHDWEAILAPFNDASEITYEKVTPKKRKMIDMKRFLRKDITVEDKGTYILMHMALGIYPDGALKPTEVWDHGHQAFQWPVSQDYEIHRTFIGLEKEGEIYTPLDEGFTK